MPTDTSERGLERRICAALTGQPCEPPAAPTVGDVSAGYGGVGWSCSNLHDYDREYCVDLVQLSTFLRATQPETAEALDIATDSATRRKFLTRLRNQISERGTIDVLRNGIKHRAHDVRLFYGTPSPGNAPAKERFEQNRFTVTRQLRYSLKATNRALDLGLFINGLPVFTFELKNQLTKQTVNDAIEQYKQDRDPSEPLFKFGRCIAHFAVDENEVRFCTHLRGKASWFLPFNKGWEDGAGNPPNPAGGLKTDYLWLEVLRRDSLTDIVENYAQITSTKDRETGKGQKTQIWPRYHQLDVVRKLLADVKQRGAGQRYLIQHSAGSGKSNSIAWLAHQLPSVEKEDGKPVFDSVIVVTDRVILDWQIRDTIRQFNQVGAFVGHAEKSGDLRKFIREGKKVIISTVQKFPFILSEIGAGHRNRHFAIIIDEAHSSQGGRTSQAMTRVLGGQEEQVPGEQGEEGEDEAETYEDQINRRIEERRMLTNASYFAFTATPKNKTLEIFGAPNPQADGAVKHHAFHNYTMKQAIQEGFIRDVLSNYTPVRSYYRLLKTVEDDPEFDTAKALGKLQGYVRGHEYPIRQKAEVMVDHFEKLEVAKKIGGQARAMVVTDRIQHAISYYHAISDYLQERNSPYKALVAFTGEPEFGGQRVTENSLNRFPSRLIPERFRQDPYRFLICADKFQTGYDEPLLHTMYVDKTLAGIKAVQTLSRLNRAHPKKHNVVVLDFLNDADIICESFAPFYRATILADETDPNQLHDLQAMLDGAEVYTAEDVTQFARHFLQKDDRSQLDPILDRCVACYLKLDEDGQVAFKSGAKKFLRLYDFLSCLLPDNRPEWEERSIFLNFLVLKLPSPQEEDLSRGVLELIDMDSYRVEKQKAQAISLPDEDGEVDPKQSRAGQRPDPDLGPLSEIVEEFNRLWGSIPWEDADRVGARIAEELPTKVAADDKYQNAIRAADEQNARIEHKRVLRDAITDMLQDEQPDSTQIYREFTENPDFKEWLENVVFNATYRPPALPSAPSESTTNA